MLGCAWYRHKCWLIISSPWAVTSVGDLETFSPPSTTLCMQLRVINILLYFLGRVRFSSSNGSAPWMPWYDQRMMVRVIDLIWLLMMGFTLLFSSMLVRGWRNCSYSMLLSLTPDLWKIMCSIFCKPSPIFKWCLLSPLALFDRILYKMNLINRLKYGKKTGLLASESPYYLLLQPPGRVNDLLDFRSKEDISFWRPLIIHAQIAFYKTYKTIMNA